MYYRQSAATDVIEVPAYHDGEGVFKTRALFDDLSRLTVKMQVWELDSGVSEGSHTHEGDRPLEEVYYFLHGTGTMWADGEEFPVTAGDAVMVPPGSDHGFRNTGSEQLKLLIIWGKPRD